jgi:hypothetical protein
MADLDLETVERVARWCAEAGRQCAPAEIRAALGSLTWDELLAMRALLADPPPDRPLGPYALADLARGLPADAAAEREREQRYPRPDSLPAAPTADAAAAPAPPRPARGAAGRKDAGKGRARAVLVRKASALRPSPPPPPPPRPLLDELHLPAGRNELEQLFRKHGGRRPHLLAAIAASHRRADGAPVDDADLDRLLEHHGLSRGFQRRERDELRHALRAAGGVLTRTAAAVGFTLEGLGAALARLDLEGEAEALREARRNELRGRATLAERAQLLLTDQERLADLGVLAEFEKDLADRLPEHLRALARQREPVALGVARTLSLTVKQAHDLLASVGVALPDGGAGSLPGARPITTATVRRVEIAGPRAPRASPRAGTAARGEARSSVNPKDGPRSGPPRSGPPRSGPPRAGSPRSGPPRAGAPSSGPSRGGPPRSGPPRSAAPRPGPGRSAPPRAGGARPPSPRDRGPRPAPSRPGGRRGPNR